MSIVLLACRHTGDFHPPPTWDDDALYCRKCRDYKKIVARNYEWLARCAHCKYSRRFGTDETRARRLSTKHVARHPSHAVRLTDGGKTDEMIKGTDDYLPGLVDWIRANPDHQARLRSLPIRNQ